MKAKSLFSIEILSYILKFVFAALSIFLLYLAVNDALDLFDVLFTKNSELYNYDMLRGKEKHPFLAYLYDHQYSIYGGNSTQITGNPSMKISIVLYSLFGFISHFLLLVICVIAALFFHNMAEKKLYDKKNARKLIYLIILLASIPIIELIGDQIILGVTTSAINDKIQNVNNYLKPGVKFLGLNYQYFVAALFVTAQYFTLRKANEEINYIEETKK